MPNVTKREQKLESAFQAELIKELEALYPECIILKNDAQLRTGIPDLIVLYKNKWVMLEVKAAWNSDHQPNQDYYIDKCDDMSFGAFIYPENKEAILDAIQQTFRSARKARAA
jgi:hypothetical protein